MTAFILIWLSILSIAFIIYALNSKDNMRGTIELMSEMYSWYMDKVEKENNKP